MNFTETPFLLLLLAVYGLWLLCWRHYGARVLLLLAGSLVFYGYHRWGLLWLIVSYCLVDWGVGCWIERSRRPRLVLALGVAFNLVLLGYWKYTPMVLRTWARVAVALDCPGIPVSAENWLLPLGISFYAFTGIGYMVDVYRGVVSAERSFWRFALYKTFFPQLVAGPILRAREFLTNLQPERMPNRAEAPLEALLLLGRGFFKKMALADRIAPAIDPFFAHVADGSTDGVWALPYVYLYAFQIYFDFSGYTDIARGLGLLFGFRWPDNFRAPYLAVSVQDFWRRWHITLSLFLRDYLYIPLGGNRQGRWRVHLNLMATMLLGGLWHGASWSFVLWGGLHGLFLVVNRLWSACSLRHSLVRRNAVWECGGRCIAILLTFHSVCLAWCFFRLTVLQQSLACLCKCFAFEGNRWFVGGAADLSVWTLLVLYGVLSWAAHRYGKLHSLLRLEAPRNSLVHGFLWGFALTSLLLTLLLAPGGEKPPFIYFQF